MSKILTITSIIFILFILLVINYLVIKNKISIKYSLVWSIPFFILLLFIIIPGLLKYLTKLLGFQTGSNMIFAALIGLLTVISIALTVIVSSQRNQIRLLIQEVSILRNNDGKYRR